MLRKPKRIIRLILNVEFVIGMVWCIWGLWLDDVRCCACVCY